MQDTVVEVISYNIEKVIRVFGNSSNILKSEFSVCLGGGVFVLWVGDRIQYIPDIYIYIERDNITNAR